MIYLWFAGSIVIFVLTSFFELLLTRRRQKQCNFDCSICKEKACYKHYCDKKRSELSE